MSIWLKLLALMALAFGVAVPASAGTCNKNHPDWDGETKSCREKPVVLKREPTVIPRVETPPSPKVTEVNIPAAAASAPLAKPRVTIEQQGDVRIPTPMLLIHVPGYQVDACGHPLWIKEVKVFQPAGAIESSGFKISYPKN